ncbi:MAG TPA: glucose-1-phosphate thymidylyltransferase, partial [Balneola sp.]|nr:glucose-1-phosphate thymidylyltransferase [Balneola sp.]
QVNRVMDDGLKGPGGEYFLTAALDNMINEGKVFKIATVDEWLDCGTLPAWLETTGEIVAKENPTFNASKFPGSEIIPPVFIAEGVNIESSKIGPHVSIEEGTTIKNSTIKNSIIRDNAVLDNVETEGSTIGAHTSLKNVKGKVDVGDHSNLEIE